MVSAGQVCIPLLCCGGKKDACVHVKEVFAKPGGQSKKCFVNE